MMQKAYAEGMRALVLYAASYQDALQVAVAQGRTDDLAARINDLLLPVVKGVGSERAYEMLTLSLQTFGGSGFIQDFPIEQYVRDAKIDSLYEGTTAVQGLDLFFRKILRDEGRAIGALIAEIREFAASEAGNGRLKTERAARAGGAPPRGGPWRPATSSAWWRPWPGSRSPRWNSRLRSTGPA
jgi:hypothetical protein